MRLLRLRIRALPGIDPGFELADLAPGLTIVHGPNASGKSSICRAVRATLWGELYPEHRIDVEAVFAEEDGTRRRVERLGGSVAWELDGAPSDPPVLPPTHLAGCHLLSLRDLLRDNADTDRTLAKNVWVDMAGGYDTSAVMRARFTPRPMAGSTESAALRDAKGALRALDLERSRLASEEDDLASLVEREKAAQKAVTLVSALEEAAELARARRQLELLSAELTHEFPDADAWERLNGDERKRLDELRKRSVAAQERVATAAAREDEARGRVAAAGLPEGGLDRVALESWSERAHHLPSLESDLREARVQEGRARVVVGSLPAAQASDEVRGSVTGFLARVDRVRARRAVLEARLEAASEREPPEDLDGLRVAVDSLRSWLSAPAPSGGTRDGRVLWLAAAIAMVGALLVWVAHSAFLLLAGFGLGALVLALVLRRRSTGDKRPAFRDRFEETGLRSPDRWETSAVQVSLRELERELRDAELAANRGAIREEAQRKLQREVEPAEAELDAERRGLADALGLEELPHDLSLTEAARAMDASSTARRALAVAVGAQEQAKAAFDAALADVNAYLEGVNAPAGRDAAGVAARLADLGVRNGALATAKREADEAANDRAKAEKLAAAEEAGAAAFLDDLGEDGEAALDKRLDNLPDYQAKQIAKRDLAADVARLEGRLAPVIDTHPELSGLSADEADAKLRAAGEEAKALPNLQKEIADINAKVAHATASTKREEALARSDSASEALRAVRSDVLRQTAGRVLLEDVDMEHERASQPAVLQRAAQWFAVFTRRAYDLTLSGGDRPTYTARDVVADREVSLANLSDGTRIQLLLAVRLAFATEAEGDVSLPLFLDEALTTTDPVRLRAIFESLLVLVEEGRQVIYLTSNPTDAAAWTGAAAERGLPAPKVIDLAAVRALASPTASLPALRPAPLPKIPRPDGLSAAEYGSALAVPAPVPGMPLASLHLFHVTRHDPALLHRLLSEARVDVVGKWALLRKTAADGAFVSAEEAAGVDAWARVAGSFLDARTIGYGKSVGRLDLEASDAVSGKFIDALTGIAESKGGDAGQLIAALNARQAKGFYAKQAEKLRAYLEDRGHLDLRERLDEAGIRARVQAENVAAVEAGAMTREQINDRVRELWVVSGGDAP